MSEQNRSQPLESKSALSAAARTALAILAPVLGGFLTQLLVSGDVYAVDAARNNRVPFLAMLGLISWFMGLIWYGRRQMGLRGGRPLYAGIGFAALVWIPFLLARILVQITGFGRGSGVGQTFMYLLLFEALAVQLWTFGLVFRSLAEWRGPLTAAVGSGVLFGMLGFLMFRESFVSIWSAVQYFLLWGVVYGIIRLRTGSIIGVVIVQAVHSFTAWVVFLPASQPDPGQLQNLYLAASLVYLVVIWRLWPKEENDYRV